ncbi:MAG: YegP family protein [Bacteroidota bacterium]
MAKFEVYKDKKGEFRFRLKSTNGEIVLMSEGYTSLESAKNGIEAVKKNAILDDRFEKKTAKNGEFYFVLKATNGEIIGMSNMYVSQSANELGRLAVKKNSKYAEVTNLSS